MYEVGQQIMWIEDEVVGEIIEVKPYGGRPDGYLKIRWHDEEDEYIAHVAGDDADHCLQLVP